MAREYDEIGYWSEFKLEIVRKYATAYSTIMSKQRFHHFYIDAFAGRGIHLSRASGEFVPGSPLNALLIQPPFERLYFIDADGGRADGLREMSEDRSDVMVYEGDCNSILPILLSEVQYGKRRRALCILDPYNIDVDWKVVLQAARLGTVEIFLDFMVMDINMNVALRDPDKIRPSELERMDRFWGDRTWYDIIYESQATLFGPKNVKARSNEALAEGYRERLRDVAGYGFVPAPLPMRNSTGAVVYYLYFASPKQTGEKIVTDIFDKYRNR